jgi:hypothetical protein
MRTMDARSRWKANKRMATGMKDDDEHGGGGGEGGGDETHGWRRRKQATEKRKSDAQLLKGYVQHNIYVWVMEALDDLGGYPIH